MARGGSLSEGSWLLKSTICRIILDWKFTTTCLPGEKMTDMPFPLHAPGLYRVRTPLPLAVSSSNLAVCPRRHCHRVESAPVIGRLKINPTFLQLWHFLRSKYGSNPASGIFASNSSLQRHSACPGSLPISSLCDPDAAMQACKAMSKIGVPLYITETGVPDSRDVLRNEMFYTYFAEVRRGPHSPLTHCIQLFHHTVFTFDSSSCVLRSATHRIEERGGGGVPPKAGLGLLNKAVLTS